jgi:phosphoenolpyruvate---glycerone phosphotransferase subunit DhaL
MLERIEACYLASMLQGAAAEVIAKEALLSQLDCVTGDGDHGTTMRRAVQSLAGLLDEATDIAAMLSRTGDLFLNNDGGASSGLLGAFFLGLSQGCTGKESLDCGDLAAAFDFGLAAMKRYTKAKAGDKTMLDALEPACAALRDAARRGEPIETALRSAACAAAAGAAATKDMKAHFGRAQYLGERTVGCQDPGATTIACIFQGFASGIEQI